MEKVDKPDPYYVKISQRWENFKKLNIQELWEADTTLAKQTFPGTPMNRPRNSTHLWEANIGTDWPAGRHVIEVKAKDRYGRTISAYHMMRVTEE